MTRDEMADRLSDQEGLARTRLDRATKAKQLLESGLVAEAFEGVRQSLLDAIAEARLDQDIQELRRGLWALQAVRKLIETHIESGKLAAKDLEHITAERKKLGLLDRLRRVS